MKTKKFKNPEDAFRPFRYYMEYRPILFWESLKRLWETGKWSRFEIYMRPVKKGEKGYEEAPFEESVVWHRGTWNAKV